MSDTAAPSVALDPPGGNVTGLYYRTANYVDHILNGAKSGDLPIARAVCTDPRGAFAAIRSKAAPALFVTVTNVRTGLPRVISNDGISIDALLASACLPDLFAAVEIDGEHYWDGGYGGNPTLWPMIHSGLADDLIIVQLVPDRIEQVPIDALSIRRRVGEIVFNSSLVAEMQAIYAMRVLTGPRRAPARVAELRFHRIGPPRLELFAQRGDMIARHGPKDGAPHLAAF